MTCMGIQKIYARIHKHGHDPLQKLGHFYFQIFEVEDKEHDFGNTAHLCVEKMDVGNIQDVNENKLLANNGTTLNDKYPFKSLVQK